MTSQPCNVGPPCTKSCQCKYLWINSRLKWYLISSIISSDYNIGLLIFLHILALPFLKQFLFTARCQRVEFLVDMRKLIGPHVLLNQGGDTHHKRLSWWMRCLGNFILSMTNCSLWWHLVVNRNCFKEGSNALVAEMSTDQ